MTDAEQQRHDATELVLLREREAQLEIEIEEQKRRRKRLESLTLQLSDCKKAIAQLTLGKMRTA